MYVMIGKKKLYKVHFIDYYRLYVYVIKRFNDVHSVPIAREELFRMGAEIVE